MVCSNTMTQSGLPARGAAIRRRSGRPGWTRSRGTRRRMKPKSSSNWSTMVASNDSDIPAGPSTVQARREESAPVANSKAGAPSTESENVWAPLPVASPAIHTNSATGADQRAGTAWVSHSMAMVPSVALTRSADVTSG